MIKYYTTHSDRQETTFWNVSNKTWQEDGVTTIAKQTENLTISHRHHESCHGLMAYEQNVIAFRVAMEKKRETFAYFNVVLMTVLSSIRIPLLWTALSSYI